MVSYADVAMAGQGKQGSGASSFCSSYFFIFFASLFICHYKLRLVRFVDRGRWDTSEGLPIIFLALVLQLQVHHVPNPGLAQVPSRRVSSYTLEVDDQ